MGGLRHLCQRCEGRQGFLERWNRFLYHVIMTFLTLGIWLVWLVFSRSTGRCDACGRRIA